MFIYFNSFNANSLQCILIFIRFKTYCGVQRDNNTRNTSKCSGGGGGGGGVLFITNKNK